MSVFDLDAYLKERRQMVDLALDRFLPGEDTAPPSVHRAMRYSVLAGGKRLRPILVIAGAEVVGATPSSVMPTACAMEMIHTYSLIHDDLPAMDDDDYRRGRLTNHKVFGEAIAILAGDALLTYAFQLVAQNAALAKVDAKVVCDVVAEIAEAAGTLGMVGGQVVDIESEGKTITPAELEYIHIHKTHASAAPTPPRSPPSRMPGRALGSRSRSSTTSWTWRVAWRRWARRPAATSASRR
jgi:geranylgeranyl diphosphate synthase type II